MLRRTDGEAFGIVAEDVLQVIACSMAEAGTVEPDIVAGEEGDGATVLVEGSLNNLGMAAVAVAGAVQERASHVLERTTSFLAFEAGTLWAEACEATLCIAKELAQADHEGQVDSAEG